MREFLLLPVYAACCVLALAALVFVLGGLVLAAGVFGALLIGHALLVRLGLRTPAMPINREPWWAEEAECLLAIEEARRH